MGAADLVNTFKDAMEPYLNKGGVSKPAASLLHQLLLKASSNDKRFVVDEAKNTLSAMAASIPSTLLSNVLPYTSHKSPKVYLYTELGSIVSDTSTLRSFALGL